MTHGNTEAAAVLSLAKGSTRNSGSSDPSRTGGSDKNARSGKDAGSDKNAWRDKNAGTDKNAGSNNNAWSVKNGGNDKKRVGCARPIFPSSSWIARSSGPQPGEKQRSH